MPDERLTKNQRREQARELARREREKAQRRERLLKILVPVVVAVVLVGAGTGVAVAIASQPQPAPQTAAGPKNMITGGIQFEGKGGKMTVVSTPALTAKQTPSPVATSNPDGVPKIVTYVDFSCPACKSFEATNSAYLQKIVAAGKATLEVHPIAILDRNYQNSRYSSRANNVAACVANYAPNSFYKVMGQMYEDQPEEGTDGLSNAQIVGVVHKAGLDDPKVDSCINGERYKKFVASQTAIATQDPALVNPTNNQLSTPTILVNGQYFTGDFDQFQSAVNGLIKS